MNIPTHELIPGPRYAHGQETTVQAMYFDVDNTLVGENSPELPTEDFIALAQAAGEGAVGLVTARQPQKALHIIQKAQMRGLSVLSNGAQIYDGARGEMAVEYPMPVDSTLDIIHTLQEAGIVHTVQDDGVDYTWHPGASRRHVPRQTNVGTYSRAVDIWQPAEGDNELVVPAYALRKPLVVVAHDVTAEDSRLLQLLAGSPEHRNLGVQASHAKAHCDGCVAYDVFLTDKRAMKEVALDTIADMTGTPIGEIAVVGDGLNDAKVVGYAGVGVAMGNAVQQTLEVATHIAPTLEDDGARIALASLLARS